MDDLISEFVTETLDSLNVLDQEVVRLEQNPEDRQLLDNIFRILHTIKGTAGFLDLPRLGKVAHTAENLLDLVRESKIAADQEVVSLMLESLDVITEMTEYIGENGCEPDGDDTGLLQRLTNKAQGENEDVADIPEEEAEASIEEVEVNTDDADDYSSFFAGGDDLQELIDAETAISGGGGDTNWVEEEPVAAEKHDSQEVNSNLKRQEQAATAPVAAQKPAAAASIRVRVDVLEQLMQTVGELVLNRNQIQQLTRHSPQVEQVMQSAVQQLSNITSELQEGVLRTRMQPVGAVWSKFPRVIRDLALDLGKKIELHMVGEETELDRQVLEMIRDPLTHMIRNSCDHGLEMPDERVAAGKNEVGNVTLSAFHEGGHVVIEIRDDGQGVQVRRVAEKAMANQLVTSEQLAELSDKQIIQYIFAPGFSTAEAVTSVSGRGVGMDVVRTNIEKIGGTVELDSVEGEGSVFRIRIPLTLAIVSALIVESGGDFLRVAADQYY